MAGKTGSRRPGDIWDMGDHYMSSFWVYLNDLIKKMPKNDQSGTKPETGQNLSGKFFSTKVAEFDNEFDDA